MSTRNNLISLENIKVRHDLLKAARTFFWQHDYLEVESPIRVHTPALEDYIDAINADGAYLRTSPELHMKRLLVDGCQKIFQIGSCFRKDEMGQRHRDEFTMLEWYRKDADYLDILKETQALIRQISRELNARQDYFATDWQILTVDEAFQKYAGKSVQQSIDEDQFELDIYDFIEPNLGRDRPTVLIDYPASMAALSRKKASNPNLAERWELYIDGIEIANAYSELTDAAEQRRRFEECQKLRENRPAEVYPLDEAFLSALEKGLPECGGIALGIDRLMMCLAGIKDISQARPFADELTTD